MRMRIVLSLVFAMSLAACGTYDPKVQAHPAKPGVNVNVTVNNPPVETGAGGEEADNGGTGGSGGSAGTGGDTGGTESDATVKPDAAHQPHPGNGQPDEQDAASEPEPNPEQPDAAMPQQQETDAAQENPQPQARRICIEVRAECVLIATSDDETNDNGDPLEGIRFQPSGSFCFSVVEGENVTSLVNAITPVPDENGDFIYALSVTARNQDRNWCDNGLPGRQSNMRVDETCFVGETPSQLGFVPHCTVRDGDGWTMNWRWSNQH